MKRLGDDWDDSTDQSPITVLWVCPDLNIYKCSKPFFLLQHFEVSHSDLLVTHSWIFSWFAFQFITEFLLKRSWFFNALMYTAMKMQEINDKTFLSSGFCIFGSMKILRTIKFLVVNLKKWLSLNRLKFVHMILSFMNRLLFENISNESHDAGKKRFKKRKW